MIDSLKLILCARTHFDLDVLFFSKGLLYSSIKHHELEEQIRFIHSFDKLNQLNQFIPKYLYTLQVIPDANMKLYKNKLPIEVLMMNFHTISKTIDCKIPS